MEGLRPSLQCVHRVAEAGCQVVGGQFDGAEVVLHGVGNDGLADFDVQLEVVLGRADQSFFRSLVINDSVGGNHPVAGEGGIGKRNRAGLGGARLQGTDDGTGHGGLAGRGGVHGEGVGLLAVDAGPAIIRGSAGGVRVGVVGHD